MTTHEHHQKLPDPAEGLEDYYYSTKELSGLLNISPSTLSDYRRQGIGPQYIQVGYRTCRYPKAEVYKYLEENRRNSTSDTGGKK